MRVSTAVTIGLTVLLFTSTIGVVAGMPSASATVDEPVDASQNLDGTHATLESDDSSAASSSPIAERSESLTAIDPPDDSDARQVLRVSMDADGNAHWTIESRFILTDEENIEDFEEWADEVTSSHQNTIVDPGLFEDRAAGASEETDRSMEIQDPGWEEQTVEPAEDVGDINEDELDLEDDVDAEDVHVGVVSYSFVWSNFAAVDDDDQIHVGDAFQTEDGSWLSLTENQRLVLEPPEDYALGTDTSTQLEWEGPHEFSEQDIDVVFVHSGGIVPPALGTILWALTGIGVVVAVGTIGYLYVQRNTTIELPSPLERAPASIAALGFPGMAAKVRSLVGSDESGRPEDEPTHSTDSPRGESAGSHPAATDGSRDMGTHLEFEEEAAGVDPELLSDEERVLQMITQNGGRMKQATIVNETGWSNAKVSQLLSKMDDEDDIEKLRIGRENLITLPEIDPTELE
ncbi:hypothetical protein SAMN04487967_1077 [Natronorubrum sediminis]|uniref:IclR helix-turn-helix domain-containing protein n=1 Tax=Natronorubrum sediminis TaxID=640943 RepID=A0A1H6FRN8_9EURY|nr:hypothetical protein [Natronorubrum sediminis]SEH12992.1 hypothetical protein SAMN04487967_1077 [Natronorubrum sediminis]